MVADGWKSLIGVHYPWTSTMVVGVGPETHVTLPGFPFPTMLMLPIESQPSASVRFTVGHRTLIGALLSTMSLIVDVISLLQLFSSLAGHFGHLGRIWVNVGRERKGFGGVVTSL